MVSRGWDSRITMLLIMKNIQSGQNTVHKRKIHNKKHQHKDHIYYSRFSLPVNLPRKHKFFLY